MQVVAMLIGGLTILHTFHIVKLVLRGRFHEIPGLKDQTFSADLGRIF